MEDKDKRLERFLLGDVQEYAWTIRANLESKHVSEIRKSLKNKMYILAILGVHSVAQTLGKHVFDKKPRNSTKLYLQHFVDTPQNKYSAYSDVIHELRNVLVHGFSSVAMHEVGFDCETDKGIFKGDDGIVHLNPKVFLENFLCAWEPGGRAFDWTNIRGKQQSCLEYLRLKYVIHWLGLDRRDPICESLRNLDKAGKTSEFSNEIEKVKTAIAARFLNGNGDIHVTHSSSE